MLRYNPPCHRGRCPHPPHHSRTFREKSLPDRSGIGRDSSAFRRRPSPCRPRRSRTPRAPPCSDRWGRGPHSPAPRRRPNPCPSSYSDRWDTRPGSPACRPGRCPYPPHHTRMPRRDLARIVRAEVIAIRRPVTIAVRVGRAATVTARVGLVRVGGAEVALRGLLRNTAALPRLINLDRSQGLFYLVADRPPEGIGRARGSVEVLARLHHIYVRGIEICRRCKILRVGRYQICRVRSRPMPCIVQPLNVPPALMR